MARDKLVKTFSRFVPDIAGNREKKVIRVYFDSKRDEFYLVAPDHLAEVGPTGYRERRGDGPVTHVRTGDGRIWGRTPNEVEEKFSSACYRYEKAIRKCRKVIVYRLSYAAHDEWGKRLDGGGLNFEEGSGLLVHWDIGYEVKIGDQKAFIWRYDPTATDALICNNVTVGGEDYAVIDWTQQREDFFRDVEQKLEAMVARARQFLGDGKKLALAIDSGKFQLLLGHEESKERSGRG